MYSLSLEATIVIFAIGGIILLILLLGLIFSIVLLARQRRSRGLEITAWIFNSLWFIFDMAMAGAGVFKKADYPNFFIFPILLTFFLLCQYRANLYSGTKLKVWYVAKTAIILIIFFQLNSEAINFIYGRFYEAMKQNHLLLIAPVISLIFTLLISSIAAFRYLKRTGQPLVNNDVLKNAAIFLLCTFLCAELAQRLISFIDILGMGNIRDTYLKIYFNVMNILRTLGYSLLCTILGTLIAGYSYLNYAKKNKVELPV
ncbi:hypothetical protein [Mucilaginibacter sp. NFX135]|uniref:hypothetical protein n=1 Tax=Mucilaginibacter sp. NFX135 TaxID=3402687 RepID=UPI003AFA38C4